MTAQAQAWLREHRWARVREQQAAAGQARAEAAVAQPDGWGGAV
ncbi:hypothetical protein ACFWBF_15580 [Streptomyces sp. NPDC060028]